MAGFLYRKLSSFQIICLGFVGVILVMTAVLIAVPALVLFFFEYGSYPLKERLCLALFQAVTPRTAGFNTGDLTALSDGSRAMLLGLMLIGGAPGSTAGGMKTTTVAVLAANAVAVFRKRKSVRLFGRLRIDYSAGCAYLGDEPLKLTPMEYKLLCLLVRNTGKVLTHTYITQNIWGRSWENDVASLRVFMVTLRKKLESAPDSPQYIQTHVGIGYRMLKVE